jgi:archaellum biogenesis ATPase FlaH
MGTVRNLNPAKDLEDFCDFLYGTESGYVRMPIKNEETGEWSEAFHFEWPNEKLLIIDHVERYSSAHNVYISPALFSEPSGKIDFVKGSNVAWAEFDGSLPTVDQMQESNVPEPTIRIRSSVPGREHWYWRYDDFQTDLSVIQEINKSLAYALGADTSGWDACQVLRPVGSINHKRKDKHSVTLIKQNHTAYDYQAFDRIPRHEDSYTLENFNKDLIPVAGKVLTKTSGWKPDEIDLLFRKEMKQGSRSSALTRVAYTCCERGLSDKEVFAVLQWVDERWRKFADRSAPEKYYINLINAARIKVPYEGIEGITSGLILPTMNYLQLLEAKDEVKYIIDGILPDKGLLFIVGKSGHGKTIMATGLCKALATGHSYLDWQAVDGKPKKVLFLSLEMNTAELKLFFDKQDKNLSEIDRAVLSENFHIYAAREGQKYVPLKFHDREIVTRIIATIEALAPDIVLIDSATKAIAVDMNKQTDVTPSMELIYRIRNELSTSMIIIHHTRKDPPAHGYKEVSAAPDPKAFTSPSRSKKTNNDGSNFSF